MSDINSPVKIFGTSKQKIGEQFLTGFYYPAYLDRKEAILADLNAGGKGIYSTYTFVQRTGEFYFPETLKKLGMKRDPLIYDLYTGAGAENPFNRIQYKLSALIENQLPDFIQGEYENFILFLKAYYEFLEQNNQAQEVLQNIRSYSDIDTTSEELVEKFFKNYAENVPATGLADNRFLIKQIRQIYERKGTEPAYRLLFNILFRETIEFFYPYQIVLKASSGKWLTPYSLKVKKTNEAQDIFDFESTEVTGVLSGAKASVVKVIQYTLGEFEVYELILDPKSVRGKFISRENIQAVKTYSENGRLLSFTLNARLYSVLSEVNILDGALGYEINHPIVITDTQGKFAVARVSGVDRFGSIKSVRVVESGLEYTSNTILDPGLPTLTPEGVYQIRKGAVTINFPRQHNIQIGDRIRVNYFGNVFSPVNDTFHDAVVVSIPDQRTIRFRYPGF
jgi:hypothetical protein